MTDPAPHVLITGELAKLPAKYQPLFNPATPIPAEIRFFEALETWADIRAAVILGSVLVVGGLLMLLLGLAFIIMDLIVLVLVFAGLLILNSLRARIRTINLQRAGQHVRYGVYLDQNNLLIYNQFDYTLIPRECVAGLEERRLSYMLGDEKKELTLPKLVFGVDTPNFLAEIQAWVKQTGA
jgi:hypothetical protein